MWVPLLFIIFIHDSLAYNASSAKQILSQLNLSYLSTGYQSNLTETSNFQCYSAVQDVMSALSQHYKYALRMFDAGTKFPEGILEGNLKDLGQFDECLDTEGITFSGQHCLVDLNIGIIHNSSFRSILNLTISECFPSSCSSSTVALIVNRGVHQLRQKGIIPSPYDAQASVLPTNCYTKIREPLTTEDWIVIAICAVIALLALASTIFDIFMIFNNEVSTVLPALRSFSIYSNWKKLISTKSKSDQLNAVHGIRFLSICWVILGHKYAFTRMAPLVNLADIPHMYQEWSKMFIINAQLSVDTFFLLSGFLNAYGFFSLVNSRGKYSLTNLLVSYAHRYIRLTPPYAIMIGITATIAYRFGTGPTWNLLVRPTRDFCVKGWWENLLYINNFKQTDCMYQAWYLAADMQMFWLSPILLFPMYKWPYFGIIEMILLLIGSAAAPFAISYVDKFTDPVPTTDYQMKKIYTATYARLTPYIVGIFGGYFIHLVKCYRFRAKMKKVHLLIGWLVSLAFILYPIYGVYWFVQPSFDTSDQLSASFFIGTFRLLWSLGVGWILVICSIGYGGFINSILSWKLFWPLGRLTYCMYLVHVAVMFEGLGLNRIAAYYNDFSLVHGFFGDVMLSLGFGTLLCLLVESPTMNLDKLLFDKVRSPPTKTCRTRNINSRDLFSEMNA